MDDEEKLNLALKLADKVYDDTVSPISKEVGGFFGAVAGFFNNVVAAPLHRLNAKFKIKTEAYINNLYEQYLKIPEENLQEPAVNIVGPVLESLKYEIDEDELCAMFTNLLLSAMDNRVSGKCHPAYAKIITQMSSTDALVLKKLYKLRNNIFPIVSPRCEIKINFEGKILNGYHIYSDKFPDYYFGSVDGVSLLDISKSLCNLERLGIIKINKFAVRNDFHDAYKDLIESKEIKDIYASLDTGVFMGCSLQFGKNSGDFTEFGKDFTECVIKS